MKMQTILDPPKITNRTNEFVEYNCQFCITTPLSRVVDFLDNGNNTVGLQCVGCGNTIKADLYSGERKINSANEYNGNIDVNTSIIENFQEKIIDIFPMTKSLQKRYSKVKWIGIGAIMLILSFLGSFVYGGVGDLLVFLILLTPAILGYLLKYEKIHDYYLKNILKKSELINLRGMRLDHDFGQLPLELRYDDASLQKVIGFGLIGFGALMAAGSSIGPLFISDIIYVIILVSIPIAVGGILMGNSFNPNLNKINYPDAFVNQMRGNQPQNQNYQQVQPQFQQPRRQGQQFQRQTAQPEYNSKTITSSQSTSSTSNTTRDIKPTVENKEYCQNCGESYTEDLKFCGVCGIELSS